MDMTQVFLPDSYSSAGNGLLKEIHCLSQDVAYFDPTRLPLTIFGDTGRAQSGNEKNKTPNVKSFSSPASDNVPEPVDTILSDDLGEVARFGLNPVDGGDFEHMADILEKRNQNDDCLKNAEFSSYEHGKAISRSRSLPGRVTWGGDAGNAVQQDREYRGLFDAAQPTISHSIRHDPVDESPHPDGILWDWTSAEAVSAKAPPTQIPPFVYESSPPYGQKSPRSMLAAASDPVTFMAPDPSTMPRQHTSLGDENIGAGSTSPMDSTPMYCAASSTQSSAIPSLTLSRGSSASCLSTTTILSPPMLSPPMLSPPMLSPPMDAGLKCPVSGCRHKPFAGRSKKNSLARHVRQHDEKFLCQVEDCRTVIGRSDNRRTHLEDQHPSIWLPPKSSRPRVRNKPGGANEIIERHFTRIKV